MSKTVSDEDTSLVLEYLQSTNRPYSINDIFNNLQNKVSKANVIKALDNLTVSGKINERVNGKQKIYFAKQDEIAIDDAKLKQLKLDTEENDQIIDKLKRSISNKEGRIKLMKEFIPIELLQTKLADLNVEVDELGIKLDNFNSKCKEIDPNQQMKTKRSHAKLVDEWRKRKRLANQVIDQLLESSNGSSKKKFLEDIGVETDEDVNVTIPNI